MGKGLKAETEKCSGCQMCALVCSASHVGKFNPSESMMNVMDLYPEPGEVKLSYCTHCDEHPCVEECPAEAIKLNEALGTYYVDKDECTGCGMCVEVCPYEGCWMDPSESYAIKCDLCGGTPQCVEVCPKGVLKR